MPAKSLMFEPYQCVRFVRTVALLVEDAKWSAEIGELARRAHLARHVTVDDKLTNVQSSYLKVVHH
jgi:hypothetical protein